jgi:DNA-binding CsgD family transcriptional regulator
MNVWKRLWALLRGNTTTQPTFTLDVEVVRSLRLLAEQQNRPPEDVAANLIHAALDERRLTEECWRRWRTLTAREQEVAALVCLNYTTRQIAARLTISPDTVKSHVRNILAKFGTPTRQELRQLLDSWDFSAWG